MSNKSVCVVKFDASGRIVAVSGRCKKGDLRKHFVEVRKALEKTGR